MKGVALGSTVTSEGAQLRVQALQYAGWTQRGIGQACGLSHRTIWSLLKHPLCYQHTAVAIAKAYDELIDIDPRSVYVKFGDRSFAFAKGQARRAGYTPLPPDTPAYTAVDRNPCLRCGGPRVTRKGGRDRSTVLRCLACERDKRRVAPEDRVVRKRMSNLLEEYDHFKSFGMNDTRIAERLSMTPSALAVALARAGRPTGRLVFDERSIARAA
jgi:hypothetical protein